MKVYERRVSSPFKWIFAGLLFVIVMTFTMAEVNGFNSPPSSGGSNNNQIGQSKDHGQNQNADGDHQKVYPPDNDPPCAVPEPTTFLLMVGALGLALWYRNRKTAHI